MNERLVIEKDVKTVLNMEQKNYIAYLRQSTVKQELSGLGIEAQREIIRNYLKRQKGYFWIYRNRERQEIWQTKTYRKP